MIGDFAMKQYVVDELRLEDYGKVKSYLDENFESSALGGLYWIPVEEELLTDLQASHAECRPHYFSLELEEDRLFCELLVRTRKNLQCDCMAYATVDQRNWLIDKVDLMIEKIGVSV